MAPEADEPSLHRRLMTAVVRGARAHEESQAAIEAHAAVDAELRTTLALVRRRREQRAQARRRLRAS